MIENKSEWEEAYKNNQDQILDLKKITPENIIDEVKLEYLRPLLPKSGKIIEFGAGSGRFITRIGQSNDNYQIIGLDYVKNSTKFIKNNIVKFNLNGESICADIYHLPFKDNSFDAVVSGGLLEHFDENQIYFVLKEMIRVLKYDGLFYAEIVPRKFSLCRPIILHDAGGFESNFSKKQWKHHVESINMLKDIKIVSGVVIPPDFYRKFRSGIQLKITNKFKYIIKHMDDTIISNIFGFSYYITAIKR